MKWPWQRIPPPSPVDTEEKRALAISMAALAAASGKAEPAQFGPYTPPPGVIPPGERAQAMAMDATPYDYVNNAYTNNYFPGYQYLAALAQLPEYRKFAEVPAKDMVRKWGVLRSVGGGDKTDRISVISAEMDRFGIKKIFQRAAELDAFYGRAQLYIDVLKPGGIRASDDRDELNTPLFMSPRKIKIGSLMGFSLIEPIWTYPGIYNSSNPLSPDFYRPVNWYVMGDTVHSSRLLSFISRPTPDLLKAAYNFGGLSMTQMAQPYVNNWTRTRDSVSDMVHSFSTTGIKSNMSTVLSGLDNASFLARAELFNKLRDNRGLMMLDKDTEEFFQFNTPLGGLDSLQAQSQEHMASVSNIPLVKLLGVTPSGLNASSDSEIRVYYDDIAGMQQTLFAGNIKKVIDIIQLSSFGSIDDDIVFEFESLYGLDDEQAATVRKMDADTAAVYVDLGAVSPSEIRDKIAADPDSKIESLDDGLGEDEYLALDKEFVENEHPRENDGKFGSGGGQSAKPTETKSAKLSEMPKDQWPAHITALKLPPAWTSVKVSTDPSADLQATGKDSKGRAQYVYSKRFQDSQAEAKFLRIRSLQGEMAGINKQVADERKSSDKSTEADMMALIIEMGIRPGSEADTGAEKKAYGATTLEGRHVIIDGDNTRLQFVGKKGVNIDLPVTDQGIAKMLRERARASGKDDKLFPGVDQNKLLSYAHSLDHGNFKTKDFRTHVGTKTALSIISSIEKPVNQKGYKEKVREVAKKVATVLGNTPIVALQSYIDPTVFSGWRSNLERL